MQQGCALSGAQIARVERSEDSCGDLVDGSESVDLDQQPALVEHLEQRRRLALVDLLAVPDGLLGVVDAALLDGAERG